MKHTVFFATFLSLSVSQASSWISTIERSLQAKCSEVRNPMPEYYIGAYECKNRENQYQITLFKSAEGLEGDGYYWKNGGSGNGGSCILNGKKNSAGQLTVKIICRAD